MCYHTEHNMECRTPKLCTRMTTEGNNMTFKREFKREDVKSIMTELESMDGVVRQYSKLLHHNRLRVDLSQEERIIDSCLYDITRAIDKMLSDLVLHRTVS